MSISLFDQIRLLRDGHSFCISVWNMFDKYWLLSHLKDLTITESAVYYERIRTHRSRPGTVYKQHKIRTRFTNTIEFLSHISTRPIVVDRASFTFSNGWRFEATTGHLMFWYTNTTQERNTLLQHLLDIAGFYHIDIATLEPCYSYFIRWNTPPLREELPSLDEFWPEDEREAWKKMVREHYGW